MMRLSAAILMTVCSAGTLVAQDTQRLPPARQATGGAVAEFERSVQPVFRTYCVSCHGDGVEEGGLSLEQLGLPVAEGPDFERWRLVLERVKYGEMPPPDADQPTERQRAAVVAWVRGELLRSQHPASSRFIRRDPPRYGNYVDHAALFHGPAGPVVPGRPRVWRLRPQIYREVLADVRDSAGADRLSDPLSLARGRGLKDYATRYFVDEPTTQQLLANAQTLVRVRSRSALELLNNTDEPPSVEAVEQALRLTFEAVLRRGPTASEVERLYEFYRGVLKTSGRRLAAERLLMAVYMQPEALFREELGGGPPDRYGRTRLAQREIAFAVSYALGNRPDARLLEAARRGELATRDQVAAHVARRFKSPHPTMTNPRLLQFFREYFDYPYATEVFKTSPPGGSHSPQMLTTDLDLLIAHLVDRDAEVLYRLLTTNEYFVACRREPQTGKLMPAGLEVASLDAAGVGRNPEPAAVYGLPRDWIWTDRQPVRVPEHVRAGVLTHPAWLVAWSGNFDNQPVQRGKWIRTHLLGGTVPELPIGVNAVVPEDDRLQFRERLSQATAAAECQRCHRKMDRLGFPFEQYDHFGRFRIRERGRPVDTSGAVAYVDDPELAGPVSGPLDLVRRLAQSRHVEQVFVRYCFRYFLGRNETLGDARTLRDAHRAYRENGGSFRALVVSLLTSDSFLYRFAEVPDG